MELDPSVIQLGTHLAEVALRNGASAISDRIRTAKAGRDDKRTIGELEEIINELLEDRAELLRISESYKEHIAAQEISEADLAFISEHLVPRLMEVAQATGTEAEQLEEVVSVLKPLLATETIKVMQLLGFDFRKALGQPLTNLIAAWIGSRTPPSGQRSVDLQQLQAQREVLYLQLAHDEKAMERWTSLMTQSQ